MCGGQLNHTHADSTNISQMCARSSCALDLSQSMVCKVQLRGQIIVIKGERVSRIRSISSGLYQTVVQR